MNTQYLLMNKNKIVAEITSDWGLKNIQAPLPLGMKSFDDWIENRKAYKHNQSLKKLMLDLGCNKKEGFIKVTNCSSLNDAYWVYDTKTNRTWNKINLYDNKFNEVVSRLAFEGFGLYGGDLSSTTPELTSDGSYKKCWKRLNGSIYLYKQGKDIGFNSGLEPYCEVMASELNEKVCIDSVKYTLSMLHRKITSCCELFTNKDIGYVPLSKILPLNITFKDIQNYFYELGAEEKFREIMVMDAITFNVDRHLGNIGVLVNNDTQVPIDIAPNFDFNMALLPYVIEDEFDDIGSKLLEYSPKMGNDFTQLGQKMLTDKIKDKVKDLQDFHFSSFNGDKKFTKKRINQIEDIVHKQIDAILSKEILKTKDVFIPNLSNIRNIDYDNSVEIQKAEELKNIISNEIINITEDNHVEAIFTFENENNYYDIIINMFDDSIVIQKDGIDISSNDIPNQIVEKYDDICKIYDSFVLDNNIIKEK